MPVTSDVEHNVERAVRGGDLGDVARGLAAPGDDVVLDRLHLRFALALDRFDRGSADQRVAFLADVPAPHGEPEPGAQPAIPSE